MVITEPLPSAVKDIVNDTKIMKKSAILNQDKFCAIYWSIHKKNQAVLMILWKLHVLCVFFLKLIQPYLGCAEWCKWRRAVGIG